MIINRVKSQNWCTIGLITDVSTDQAIIRGSNEVTLVRRINEASQKNTQKETSTTMMTSSIDENVMRVIVII